MQHHTSAENLQTFPKKASQFNSIFTSLLIFNIKSAGVVALINNHLTITYCFFLDAQNQGMI